MGLGADGIQAEDGTDFGSGMEEDLADAGLESGDFDAMAEGDGRLVIAEPGMPE